MEELVHAFPIGGAPYSYLLNVSRKSLALLAAALMLLDFSCTSVVSAATASSYITAELPSSPVVPAPALTLALLVLFAIISLSGLKESARIAAGVLAFHVLTMVVLGLTVCVRLGLHGGSNALLVANWRLGNLGVSASQVVKQLFEGFCLGMLGMTGIECTPSYAPYLRVSTNSRSSTFARVLRNLHLPAILLNAGMMLLVLSLVPLADILGENGSGNLLSLLGQRAGGRWLRTVVVVDATVVLCGGVLSGILSACQLFEQLARDRILPTVFLSTLPLTDAPHVSILAITLLNAAFYGSAAMSVSVVSKMFSLVWLTLMGIFPLALWLMRFNRGRMRPASNSTGNNNTTRLSTIFLALVVTAVVFAGNVAIDVSTAGYFAAYLVGVLLVFGATQNQARMLRGVYWVYDQYPALHRFPQVGERMVRVMARLRRQPVCVLVKGDEINHLLHMILYVRDNEETSCVKLEEGVGGEQVPSELEANARILDEAFPEITIDLIIIQDTFTSTSLGALAQRLGIPPSLMFMSCPGPRFPWAVVAETGVRIISR
ncbi:AAAP amino acid permease [Mycena amicta]|nr:AAAP amino acid permease [Mycena amicta]